MKHVTSGIRIVLGLASLSLCAVLLTGLPGQIREAAASQRRARESLTRAIAMQFEALGPRSSSHGTAASLQALADAQPDVDSIGLRSHSGELLVTTDRHIQLWSSYKSSVPAANEFVMDVPGDHEPAAQVEVRFREAGPGLFGLPVRTILLLLLAVSVLVTGLLFIYVRRALQVFNPARVIPPRVREALDALAEGLLVLDTRRRIALVNRAFEKASCMSRDQLLGQEISVTRFELVDPISCSTLPWDNTLETGQPVRGILMSLESDGQVMTFSVNVVQITDKHGRCRGLVVGFEDVTAMERQQAELKQALHSLRQSSEEIRKQNRELEWLATRDALTGCINRRSFFQCFDQEWNAADQSLAAVMIDIDFFKSINDNYGHAMGDDVLRHTASVIMRTVRDSHVVCRYGGEEFAVLMPGLSIDEAEICAERVRLAVEGLEFSGVRITASLGVAARDREMETPQDLLSRADRCLYAAKRSGRNCVVRSDSGFALDDLPAEETANTGDDDIREMLFDVERTTIPFQAVTALVAALSYRDHATAAHSRRVADLCVAAAEGLLSMRECYTLEIAALLHDIGKIGVPDNILHKVTPLTDDEWEVMQRHDILGVQLVRAAFAAPLLTEMMVQHSVWYDLSNSTTAAAAGRRPCIAARILAIADAYDAMTSDAPFRKRVSRSQAFAELRRCAATQFDPELVERFISAVRLRSEPNTALTGITMDSALTIGLQIERLVAALDDQDLPALRELTERIHATSDRCGIESMVSTATLLKGAIEDGSDMIEIMQVATELLDLCRMTQGALITSGALVNFEPSVRPGEPRHRHQYNAAEPVADEVV